MESEISESVRSARRSAIPIQAKTVIPREKTGPITRQILSIVTASYFPFHEHCFPVHIFFYLQSEWTELPRSYDGHSRSPRSLQGYRFRRGIRFSKRLDKFQNSLVNYIKSHEVCNGDCEFYFKRNGRRISNVLKWCNYLKA